MMNKNDDYGRLDRMDYQKRARKRMKMRKIKIIMGLIVTASCLIGAVVYNSEYINHYISGIVYGRELNKEVENVEHITSKKESNLYLAPKIPNMLDEMGAIIEKNVEAVKAQSIKEEKDKIASTKESKTGEFSEVVPKSDAVESSYFKDAVFIGDSRTEGLIINTGISTTFFGNKGLTVDTAVTQEVIKLDKSKKRYTIPNALSKKSFAKVYIMFGVNELGWAREDIFIQRYEKLVQQIKELQPEATIYIQSILPVSKEKETKDKLYNNAKIRRHNKSIKKIAKLNEVYYLDVHSAVKEKSGTLPKDASIDGVHLNKTYCKIWLDYLKTHTVD